MDRNELIMEQARLFNRISAFIETNKGKISREKILNIKKGQRINGFIDSIFKEYGVNDGKIVINLFSDFLQAAVNVTSSSAKAFSAIYSESSSDIGLGAALAASRPVTESAIKIHYLTSAPLKESVRYLFAEDIEHHRRFCESKSDSDKKSYIYKYSLYTEVASQILDKLNLPSNPQLDALEKKERKLLNDTLSYRNAIQMAQESKKHIDGNFRKLTLDKFNHESLIYHYRFANGYVHVNPSFINMESKNRHFWLTMMAMPTMLINCLLMTKFLPVDKSEKTQGILLSYVQDFKNMQPDILKNRRI